MNLYDELYRRNHNNLKSNALCQFMRDGSYREITYGEMFERIDRNCEILSAAGYKPGDRIGICGAASPEWNIAFYSIAKMHCTAVLIDHGYQHDEMLKIVLKARLKGLYLNDTTKQVLNDPVEGVNIYRLDDGSLEKAAEFEHETEMANPEAAFMVFSSGTTSTAAGIIHKAESAIRPLEYIHEANDMDHVQRFMAFLPNSHIYGCDAQVTAPMLYGGSVCFMEELSAPCIFGVFDNFHPTIILGVPKVFELLQNSIITKIESKAATKYLFRALFPICLNLRQKTGINIGRTIFKSIINGIGGSADILIAGGAPVRRDTVELYYGVGMRPLITYGASETSVPTLGNYGDNITMHSCGKAYPEVDVRIADDGEMQLRTPYLMLGYFDDTERTAEAFTEDGWFRTGDVAEFDPDGNIIVKGRCKENIVLATGKKVAPDDVETLYKGVPGVKDFTVSGVQCEDGSYDEVFCFAVPESGWDPETIKAAYMERSAEAPIMMKLQGVHIVPEIPRTAIGKPKRYQLAKIARSGGNFESVVTVDTNELSVAEKVEYAIKKISKRAQLEMDDKLLDDLAIDSLSIMELCIEIETLTGVRIDNFINRNSTVQQVIDVVENPPEVKEPKKVLEYPLKHRGIDYKIMRLGLAIINLMYKVDVRGTENIPNDSGCVICANHTSNFDYLYLVMNFARERYEKTVCMAKKELFTGGFFSRLICRIGGMVPIDRGGVAAKSLEKLQNRLNTGWNMISFPEGTRTHDGEMMEFKHGASKLAVNADIPIVPAHIAGGFEAYPRTNKLPNLRDSKKGGRYEIKVLYGEPIYPAGREPEEVTQELREAIEKLKEQNI